MSHKGFNESFITRLSSRLLQDDRLSASPAGGKQEIEIEQYQLGLCDMMIYIGWTK